MDGLGNAAIEDPCRTFDTLIASSGDMSYSIRKYADPEAYDEAGALRLCDIRKLLENPRISRNKKCLRSFVDFVEGWVMPDGFSLELAGEILKNGMSEEAVAQLPLGLKPGDTINPSSIMQLVLQQRDDGSYDVFKHFLMNEQVTRADAERLCVGELFVVTYRPNHFGAKKAFQYMLQKTKGWRLLFADAAWAASAASGSKPEGGGTNSREWTPTVEEITAGMAFIKENAPPSGTLEQVEWILIHVKACDSSIRGWPLSYVQKCCEIKAKSKGGAAVEQGFPISVFDLKNVFTAEILPQVIPYAPDHGFVVVGKPGSGKTPFVIALASGMGQYWIDSQGFAAALAYFFWFCPLRVIILTCRSVDACSNCSPQQ